MKINSAINILGGLPDFELINVFFKAIVLKENIVTESSSFTKIKTQKSIQRFERAIRTTFFNSENSDILNLTSSFLINEGITDDTKMLLFWNMSYNNELMNYLNLNVFYPALYSGRIAIRQEEVEACIKELKHSEQVIQEWSDSTINITASKYLTLLKKFNLMEGGKVKRIICPYIDDKMLLVFVYWLLSIETKPNLLESLWLKSSFLEKEAFVERILQKRFAKYINLNYTGDKLSIEPVFTYKEIYNAITQS